MNAAGTESALRVPLLLLLATAGGTGCIPEYHAPAPEEPHAIVKMRRSYDARGGTTLRERLLVDDHSAYEGQMPVELAGAPHVDTTLVWPTPARYAFSNRFFHSELRQVYETHYEQVSSTEFESYSCGSGTSYRSCTRSVQRYHSEPHQRLVSRWVEVSDGSCEVVLRFSPEVNHVYLLQYTYQESTVCSLACFEQVPESDGSFKNRPCRAAPP